MLTVAIEVNVIIICYANTMSLFSIKQQQHMKQINMPLSKGIHRFFRKGLLERNIVLKVPNALKGFPESLRRIGGARHHFLLSTVNVENESSRTNVSTLDPQNWLQVAR